MREWQLQTAKNQLSQLIRDAEHAPQAITLHGKRVAVVVATETYMQLTRPAEPLLDFLRASPLAEVL